MGQFSTAVDTTKATTGACHDSKPYLAQVKGIERRYSLVIKEATADRAYGSAEIIEGLLAKDIHPYIPLFSTRSGSFVAQEAESIFFEAEYNRYRCEAGHYLYPYAKNYGGSVIYRSQAKDCKRCPLSQFCKARPKGNQPIRYVLRNIHQALYEAVKQEMSGFIFLNRLSERLWKAEGIISEAKHRHDLQRAKYHGLNKVQIQAWMFASVQNIKRLIAIFILWSLFFNNLKQDKN